MALEIAFGGDVIVWREKRSVVGAEHVTDFVERPDVELALLAFRIRIERGGERPLPCRHFAVEPADGFARTCAEQFVAAAGVSERQQFEQLGVVVKHFLEMRHEPPVVDRIARKAAAEMIVDAAFTDPIERAFDDVEKSSGPFVAVRRAREIRASGIAEISAHRAVRH